MKKILIAGAIALVAGSGLVSCGGSSSSDNAVADSLATSFGQLNGYQLSANFKMIPEEQLAKYDKSQIIAGIKQILMADTANYGYMAGLNIGMNLQSQLMQMEQSGVKIDRQKVMKALEAAFKVDSVSQEEMLLAQTQLQTLSSKVREEAQKKLEEERAKSPEAQKNAKDGKEYVDKQKAADPEIKTTASGLSYKITAAGSGDATPGDNDVAKVKYTGRLIDGTVFDSSEDNAIDFPVNQVIPGFTEALKMMKKGQKMTIYIPGELAYGVNGTPDGKIGPNATLVFDVELVDFSNPAEAAKAAEEGNNQPKPAKKAK